MVQLTVVRLVRRLFIDPWRVRENAVEYASVGEVRLPVDDGRLVSRCPF